MKLKYRYTKHFVGIFILVAALIVISAFTFIIINKNVFEKKFIFAAKFSDAVGLSRRTPVYFKGFNIGNINDFHLTIDNYVIAKFEVYENYRDKIVVNSVLHKTLNPITSSSTIEFIQGRSSSKLLDEGKIIPDVEVPEGQFLVYTKEIIKSGDPLSAFIENLKNFTSALNEDNNANKGSLFRSLVNFADATEEMKMLMKNLNNDLSSTEAENYGPLHKSINNISLLTKNLSETSKAITLAFQRVDTLIANYSKPEGLFEKVIDPSGDKVLKPFSETITNLAEVSAEMKTFTNYVNSQSANLSLTIIELNKTLNQAQKFFDGINRSFFRTSNGLKSDNYHLPKERIRSLDIEK